MAKDFRRRRFQDWDTRPYNMPEEYYTVTPPGISEHATDELINRISRVAKRPVLDDLKTVGILAHSVWELVYANEPYPEAVPVLMKHLQTDLPVRVKEGIVRALTEPYAKDARYIMVDEFRKAIAAKNTYGNLCSFANALSVIGTRDQVPVLEELLASIGDDVPHYDLARRELAKAIRAAKRRKG